MEEETVCVEDSCAISSSEPYDFRMALPETLDAKRDSCNNKKKR
jgi:hypothetical protein